MVQDPHSKAVRRFAVLALATAGGVGYAPIAPGTFGSLVGAALFAGLVGRGAAVVAAAVVIAAALGVWAADEAERIFAHSDDGRIVIDEVAGQLLALSPLAMLLPPERALAPLPLLVGFCAFRALDIAKPGPVRWAERRFRGGRGVMFDDLVAGALAALLVAGAALAGVGS